MRTVTITVLGAPRTKKNHGRRIWRKNKRTGKSQPFHVPSEAHEVWCERASWQARLEASRKGWPRCTERVSVKALIYRDVAVTAPGDHNGYTQAIGDMLQYAGVIADDKLIHDWDGTRILKDADNPRIEITITVVA